MHTMPVAAVRFPPILCILATLTGLGPEEHLATIGSTDPTSEKRDSASKLGSAIFRLAESDSWTPCKKYSQKKS